MDESQVESVVRERAQRDPEFRELLLTDPRAALSQLPGLELPESLSVRVVEEDTDEVVLVVPPPRPAVDDLDAAELEKSSGAGESTFNYSCGCSSVGC